MEAQTLAPLFTEDDLVYAYTRAQAIDDGVIIDANAGDLKEVTEQFFKIPVGISTGLYALMTKAVKNGYHSNDYKGVWHDITWMLHLRIKARDYSQYPDSSAPVIFMVIITWGGRKRNHWLKATIEAASPFDSSPCLFVSLVDEID